MTRLSAQRSFSSSTRVVAAAAALLLVIDGLPAAVPATDGVAGALDPLAHLATAVIVLVALRPPVPVAVAAGLAVVAIDIDHIPSYLGWDGLTASNGRPYTHSAALVVVLLAVAFASRRVRLVASGAALGVTLHLWRDLVTGPGIPLVWPLAAGGVRLPYLVYGLPLALITVVALARSADQGVRARPAASSR